ncbi:MAG TPA: lanthionine synthetase LanC family protein [Nitrososphaeraceae archaeon]|nr:lanthionine synthetase LanC family protein [Nitrososphaeraceae archaeon]
MNYDNIFLDTAEKIGIHLCKTAFWHEKRCNWIGKAIQEIAPMVHSIYLKSLGCNVYDGTAGIAFFLSTLYRYTKNDDYRETTEGAIIHALSKVNELSSTSRFSVFTGKLGIAYVCTQIGNNLDRNIFIEKALDILRELQDNFEKEHLMDFISGNASGIPALLNLYDFYKDEKILNLSVLLGDELIETATKDSYGWSWDYRANGVKLCSHNLAGFSHGAAGIGYSLLELFNITKDTKYLEAVNNAFSYENHWFSEQNNNWPDFRSDGQGAANKSELSYAVAWCHGAPGIGLSRIRAYDLIKDTKYLVDSQAALKTSVMNLEQILNSNSNPNFIDFSLCHGLSGISETLLYADSIFKDGAYKSVAEKVGLYGIEKYVSKGLPWPCGIRKGGETPSLMLGLAGIGYFYLQLNGSLKISNPLMVLETS